MTTGIGQLVAPSGNVYDPNTNTYRPVAVPSIAPLGPGGGVEAQPTAWDAMSNQQKSDFYAANPGFAAVTQNLQGLFSLTTPGLLQAMLDPAFVAEQASIARGGLNSLVAVDDAGTMANSPGSLAAMNAGLDIGHSGQGTAETGVSAAGEANAGGPDSGGGADNGAYAQGGLVSTPFQGEVARMVASLPQFRSRL